MASDGWAGVGWPKEWGGRGLTPIEQFVFFDESIRAGAAGTDAHDQLGRADDHAVRQRGAEAVLRAEDPRRGDPLRDRLHRARRRHRPRVAQDPRRARRRRVRDQRAEDLHDPRAAPTTCGSRCAPTRKPRRTRASRSHRARTDTPGFSLHPSTTSAGVNTNVTLLRRHPRPAGNLVGEENQGWRLITNQLNHERVTLCRPRHHGDPLPARRTRAGRRRPSSPTVAASSTWRGCADRSRPRPRQARSMTLRELEDGLARRPSGATAHPADASSIKVFGTEFYMEAARLLMEVMGDQAPISGDFARRGGRAAGRAHAARRTSSRSAAAPTRCSAT